eukprot:358162-Chlamydomonas_euryale.AAC.14
MSVIWQQKTWKLLHLEKQVQQYEEQFLVVVVVVVVVAAAVAVVAVAVVAVSVFLAVMREGGVAGGIFVFAGAGVDVDGGGVCECVSVEF